MYINTKIYESIVSKMSSDNGDVNGGADGCNNALNSGGFEKIGIKKQRRIDTDERIFRAAVIEFADKGYGGAKVMDIAKTAGISAGLIIQNYGGKEELFMAVTECFVEDLYSALDGKCGDWKYLLGEIANSTKAKLLGKTVTNTEYNPLEALFATSDTAANSVNDRRFASSDTSPNTTANANINLLGDPSNSTGVGRFASSDAIPNNVNINLLASDTERCSANLDAANLTRFFITASNTKSTPKCAKDLFYAEFLKTSIPAAMKQGQSDGELIDGDIVEIYKIFFRTMSNVLGFCAEHNMQLPPTDWFLQLLTKQ